MNEKRLGIYFILLTICLVLTTFTLVYSGSEMFKLRNRVNEIEDVLWEEVDEFDEWARSFI